MFYKFRELVLSTITLLILEVVETFLSQLFQPKNQFGKQTFIFYKYDKIRISQFSQPKPYSYDFTEFDKANSILIQYIFQASDIPIVQLKNIFHLSVNCKLSITNRKLSRTGRASISNTILAAQWLSCPLIANSSLSVSCSKYKLIQH